MDKAIAKVNQNELDWYENLFNTAYSVSKSNRLFSDCTSLLDVCINFIKTLFQILRNDVRQYKQVLFSNCVCKYQMFINKKTQNK